MARTRKQGLDYFPHDIDASYDEKIEAMEALFGLDGYAFVFKMYEKIYRAGYFCVVSDAETRQIIARNVFNWDLEKFETILAAALKRGIFDPVEYKENGILTSNGIKARFDVVNKKREKSRQIYIPATETIQKNSRNVTESTQSKVKESKGKESKEENKTPAPPAVALHKFGKKFLSMTREEWIEVVAAYGDELVDQEIPEADLWIEKSDTPNGRKYRKPGYNHYLFFRNWIKGKRLINKNGRRKPDTWELNQHLFEGQQ